MREAGPAATLAPGSAARPWRWEFFRRFSRPGRWTPPALLRSAGLRFAGLYAALFGLSALALAVFLWWDTAALLDRQVDASIHADAEGLNERWQAGGLPALIVTIRDRLVENVDDDAIYLLVDTGGHWLAGNLDRWPAGVAADDDWYELPIVRDNIRSLARVHTFDLPGGFHLLVGRDVEARVRLRHVLTDALLWALLVIAGLGGVGALLVRSVLQNTLADISRTTAAIGAGDLSRRVQISGRGDEFDHLAETINDMLERIGRLMDGVREVSNAIAHDLRTPITRARARLEDALAHAAGETDLRAAIERAEADLDGIVAIFQAILRIAEIEAGARRSAFTTVDLAPLLADLAEFYGAVAEERGIAFASQSPARFTVSGDRDMIQQAVANLLDNALKFSPPGGEIRLIGEDGGDTLRIIVSDQGPGIPEAERRHVTERFYRGESARNTPGSGLGLALAVAVAQLHDGTLTLGDNAPGLRAILTLPARRASADA